MNNSLIDKIKDKLILGAGIAAVATISYNELKDSPETYVGFNEIKKEYTPIDFDIPTRGDVILIEKLENKKYETYKKDNGDLVIEGDFYYKIRPQSKFTPQVDHSDMYGNTPENSDYWSSTRSGKVILRQKKVERNNS